MGSWCWMDICDSVGCILGTKIPIWRIAILESLLLCVFVGVCVGTGGGTPPPYLGAVQRHSPLLLQGFQCCGVVGLVGDFVDEVAVDDAAVFVEDEDASGEEPCEGSVNEL